MVFFATHKRNNCASFDEEFLAATVYNHKIKNVSSKFRLKFSICRVCVFFFKVFCQTEQIMSRVNWYSKIDEQWFWSMVLIILRKWNYSFILNCIFLYISSRFRLQNIACNISFSISSFCFVLFLPKAFSLRMTKEEFAVLVFFSLLNWSV